MVPGPGEEGGWCLMGTEFQFYEMQSSGDGCGDGHTNIGMY